MVDPAGPLAPEALHETGLPVRTRVSRVLLFVIVVVALAGSFGIWRLTDYRTYADDLRDVFFRSTEYLGDLNNYTSDFRADEGALLLARRPDDLPAIVRDMAGLDARINQAWRNYRAIGHDPRERAAEALFETRWTTYRALVDRVIARISAGQGDAAREIYLGASRQSYDRASDTLGQLTDLNVENAAIAARNADTVFYETRALYVAVLVFAAAMIGAALFTIRRSIADPLTDLAGVMRQLAAQNTEVEIAGRERGDEIGAMARAVEVFRLNSIDLAISQRMLADQASLLSGELAREQRLTAIQRNFLTMASHELRTPLTHIDGHAQRLLAKADRIGADDVLTRARAIRGDVQRITTLIEDLIDRARLADAGPNSVLEPARFDLVELLREICAFHRGLLHNLFILERYDRRPIMITADPRLLDHVFNNLIGNAVKYARAHPQITISTQCHDDRVEIRLTDQGIGIPADELDRVFDRHFRASNVVGAVGTGLGLFIVRTLVDLHHGQIVVNSQVGEGTCFVISLPLGAGAGT